MLSLFWGEAAEVVAKAAKGFAGVVAIEEELFCEVEVVPRFVVVHSLGGNDGEVVFDDGAVGVDSVVFF